MIQAIEKADSTEFERTLGRPVLTDLGGGRQGTQAFVNLGEQVLKLAACNLCVVAQLVQGRSCLMVDLRPHQASKPLCPIFAAAAQTELVQG